MIKLLICLLMLKLKLSIKILREFLRLVNNTIMKITT